MSRLLAVAVLAVLVGLLAPAGTVVAGAAELDAVAVEDAEEEPPGLSPRPADAPDNPAAPDQYEAPWTWGLAFLLLGSAALLVLGVGLLYYLLVYRPNRQQAETR